MGTGHSAAVQDHLHKWESALTDLEGIAAANRRMLDQDRIYGDAARGAADRDEEGYDRAARRPSSLVSFNHNAAAAGAGGGADGTGGVSASSLPNGGRSRSNHASPESRQVEPPKTGGISFSNVGSALTPPGASDVCRSIGSASGHPKHSRVQTLEIKKIRTQLFKSYEEDKAAPVGQVMECSHFGAVAVALSYLLGGAKGCSNRRGRVTVEDIFFAAQVPLHFLHTGPPHLPTMTDIVREFLDVDNRFKGDYGLETVHFDILPSVGQVDLGPNDVGDRQTRMQLTEFRRLITQDIEEETQVVCVVNYDPYVLEQEMLVDAFDDEDEVNALAASVLGNPTHHQRNHMPRNDGAYAVVVDIRNAVQLMVTIAEGVVGDSLAVRMTEVPAAALFKAMMSAEEGRRARGFIRVFKKDAIPEMTHDEINLFWTPELCSGKVLGPTLQGTASSVVSHHISPHIVGVAWALHLLGGARPGTHGYGNGLPVSDIVRVMKFPAEVYLDGSLPLEQVYEYSNAYLRRTERPYVCNLYPVLTKISREDAVPTISVFDLEAILLDVSGSNEDAESPEHVMVIMYNASVAHNVLYVVDQEQWCVLAGYDRETQTALLIDAHPKTFSHTWTCPLDRLHKAMTGTGYLIFSKSAAAAAAATAVSSPSHQDSTATSSPTGADAAARHIGAPSAVVPMVQARLELLESQKSLRGKWDTVAAGAAVPTFYFPSLPVMPTMVAMAVSRVGPFTTFDNVIHSLPFAISCTIIRAFTLEALHVCMSQYLEISNLSGELSVTAHHGDICEDGKERLTVEHFTELIEAAQAEPTTKALIVHFDASMLQVLGAASPFGSLGIVVGYDKAIGSVMVTDCNPNSYLRTWAVSLNVLHQSVTDNSLSKMPRVRGCLLLEKGKPLEAQYPAEHSRAYKLALLPVKSVFHISPSPQFQGLSMAFSQLGFFYSPEEIFYEAYLKTMNDQRLRGSQAFAWRDVDVSLSVINKGVDAQFMAKVCTRFLESRITASMNSDDGSSSSSNGYIHVDVVDDIGVDVDLHELLLESTSPSANSVLIINYDTRKGRNIANMESSVALVQSYDPEGKRVQLWDAEFALLGLSFSVTVDQLSEMAGVDCHGHTPYGFVRFTRTDSPPKVRRQLLRPPPEDDAE